MSTVFSSIRGVLGVLLCRLLLTLATATLVMKGALMSTRAAEPSVGSPQRTGIEGGLEWEETADHARWSQPLLSVQAEKAGARWSIEWTGRGRARITEASVVVEVGGEPLRLDHGRAAVRPFRDPLGSGQEWSQAWTTPLVIVERELRIYDGLGVVTVGGRIRNRSQAEVTLGRVIPVKVRTPGGWQLGDGRERPAAVFIQSHSLLQSLPFEVPNATAPSDHEYRSSGVLALADRGSSDTLVVGSVRADEAVPSVRARYERARGGMMLEAGSSFQGRRLRAGDVVELNRIYLASGDHVYTALERYGEALGKFAARPVRNGPTGLWCSWYAHRMGMTEERVLANAEVAARHFRPLGLEIMQLDHGWQRADVTGDWVPNERFPHGLKWLADQLRDRYGLKLGLWIAPTDVAESSDIFRQHPDWMLRGDDGKPRVNWRWYWKPNPDCYELDATHPEAARWLVETFRNLTGQGASYFKIDFIASAGGEHFVQRDPYATRGWSALRRAMECIREGAGDRAWIRYCQTPPILSVGLADSTIGGGDTLDAGIPGRFDVLRENAGALAAGWWLNDRVYHREVCDMSVRMQGSIEEVRVRAALMTLANCSISWSDELCFLPPSRIRLMQQCLPPGNPAMRPVDLFERDLPSVWHLRATNDVESWDVVGVFNFEVPSQRRVVPLERLGLDPRGEYLVFEFWEERFLGKVRGSVELNLPPESSRVLAIRRLLDRPQLLGTDMHLLQGFHEVRRMNWDAKDRVLSGVYRRMPGLAGKAFIHVPEGWNPKFEFPLSTASARLTHVEGPIWMQEIRFLGNEEAWSLPFEAPRPPPAREPTATGAAP